MTEKQNIVETSTKSPKKDTPPVYGKRCGFDHQREGCPFKECMKRLISNKFSKFLLRKIILQKSFPTKASRFFQLQTYPTTGEVSYQYP